VGLSRQNELEKPDKISKGIVVMFVIKRLFGNNLKLKNSEKNIGLIFGLKKVIRFVRCVTSPVIATQSLNESRTIGSIIYPKNKLIFISTNT